MHSCFLTILLSFSLLLVGCGTKTQEEPQSTDINAITSDTVVQNSKPVTVESGLEFDKTKWTTVEGKDYPFREMMYKDLMTDTIFRKFQQDEVLSVLGKPDRSDGNYLFYTISQKRLGALPINTKTLVIKFTDDNTIEWIKLHG